MIVVEHPEHQEFGPGEDVVVVQVSGHVKLFNFRILRMEIFAVDPRHVAPLRGESGQEDVLQVEVRESKPGRVEAVGGVSAYDVP